MRRIDRKTDTQIGRSDQTRRQADRQRDKDGGESVRSSQRGRDGEKERQKDEEEFV